MSTHIMVDLVDVYAADTEDWFIEADEFFIESKIRTTVPEDSIRHSFTTPLPIWKEADATEFLAVDALVFNDIVPDNTNLRIQMVAYEAPESSIFGGFRGCVGGDEENIDACIELSEKSFPLGYYTEIINVSGLPLGTKEFTIDDFKGDGAWYDPNPNKGWDYTVTYEVTKWINDDLLGTPGKDTFVLGNEYATAGDYDYAVIRDFDVENDVIYLEGSFSDYELENTNYGTNISYEQDLIGIVPDVNDSELILGSNLEVEFI